MMKETGSSLRSGRRPSPFAFDQRPATMDDTVLQRGVADEGKGRSRRGAPREGGEGKDTTPRSVVLPEDVTPKMARVDPDPRWNGSQLVGAMGQAARG